MIDLNLVRKEPDLVWAAIRNKSADVDLDQLIDLDRQHVALLHEVETMRAERNRLAASMKGGKPDPEVIAQARALREELAKKEVVLTVKNQEFTTLLKKVPNIPTVDTPIGHSEDENQVTREWGQPRKFDFPAKNHAEIALHHGWVDKERAAKVAGSRFVYLMGDLVKLQFALIGFVLDHLTDEAFISEIVSERRLSIPTTRSVP
ncbi:MAG: hypothetical protein AB2806_15030, partial [Candidatus Thiodiazotropha sp.]